MFLLMQSPGLATALPAKPVVLLVSLVGRGFGGLETHVLNLYKQLAARGRNPLLLLAAGSSFHKRAQREQLHFYAARGVTMRGFRHVIPFLMSGLCRRHRIEVIHCNNRFEIPGAVQATKKYPGTVVFNYHVPDPFNTEVLRGVDAFVAPAPEVVRYIEQENREKNLGIRTVQAIPPMFDAERFLGYRSSAERDGWFRSTFGVTLKPCPVLCTIGNMVPDLEHKNYPLLFEAVEALLRADRPVQVMLVGDGPARAYLEKLARDRGIAEYVFFLGQNSEHVPGVLHHSDAFVLASKREAFGIVYLEAGLMKKAAIGARQTGAEVMIVDQKTGLLFENGNAGSLAAAIQALVESPALAEQLGQAAHQHVMQHFAPSKLMEQYESVYRPQV